MSPNMAQHVLLAEPGQYLDAADRGVD